MRNGPLFFFFLGGGGGGEAEVFCPNIFSQRLPIKSSGLPKYYLIFFPLKMSRFDYTLLEFFFYMVQEFPHLETTCIRKTKFIWLLNYHENIKSEDKYKREKKLQHTNLEGGLATKGETPGTGGRGCLPRWI